MKFCSVKTKNPWVHYEAVRDIKQLAEKKCFFLLVFTKTTTEAEKKREKKWQSLKKFLEIFINSKK